MKKRVILRQIDGKHLFEGNILDLPIKKTIIVEKSIEIFDDDDPCIIHQSYVIKLLIDQLLETLKDADKQDIPLKAYKTSLDYLDVENLDRCLLTIQG